jgi:hypothetical protein
MIRSLLLGVLVVSGLGAACSSKPKDADNDPVPVAGPDLPDPLTFNWRDLRFELGELGAVQAMDGHAMFTVVHDASGAHASQDAAAVGAHGSLYLDPPAFVDLDGDRHEEAVIPFVLDHQGIVYGAFVFSLRDGKPMQLGAIATTSKPGFVIEGATIKTTEGVVWRWDRTTKSILRVP